MTEQGSGLNRIMLGPKGTGWPRWLTTSGSLQAQFLRIATIVFGISSLKQGVENLGYRPIPNGLIGVALITLTTSSLFLGAETIRLSWARKQEMTFGEMCVDRIQRLQAEERHEAVVRHQEALSRLLWVEGELGARVRMGTLIIGSAAIVGNKRVEAIALIDDVGWTNVPLRRHDIARENIEHGISVAEEIPDYYLIARGQRHLAALAIEEKKPDEAARNFELSKANGNNITDETLRKEFLGGMAYMQAVYLIKQSKLDDALLQVNEFAAYRMAMGDESRLVRVHALRGQIYEQKGDRLRARDNYMKGRHSAQRVGRVDEEIRNLEGLGRVEADRQAAARYRSEAEELKAKTPIAHD